MNQDTHEQKTQDSFSGPLIRLCFAGLVAALDNIFSVIAMAALIFAGGLAGGLWVGVNAMLIGGALLAFVAAVSWKRPPAISLLQERTIPVLATAILVALEQSENSEEAQIATALAIIAASTILTGIVFLLIGYLKLGSIVRFLPFPVAAGFLAATGWLLLDGAVFVVTGEEIGPDLFSAINTTPHMLGLVFAIGFAVILYLAFMKSSHGAILPFSVLAATALFYAVIFLSGFSVEEIRTFGFLPEMPAANALQLPSLNMISLVDWSLFPSMVAMFVVVIVLSIVGLMLTMNGLELALNKDIDVDREFRSSGYANLLCGAVGGPVGHASFTQTVIADKIGATNRAVGLVMGALMLVTVFVAGPLIALVPTFIPAGLIFYLGLELLEKWLLRTKEQLPLVEWAIVVAIVAVIALVGFVEGLVAGVLFSVVVFVFNYSRQSVIRLSANGKEQRSSVDRAPAALRYLTTEGEAIEVVQLQGYLFFGTAEQTVEHVRRRLRDKGKISLRYLILDFRTVTGTDSAALTCFAKIRRLAEKENVVVLFTRLSVDIERSLRLTGLTFGHDQLLRLETDIDHALEAAEDDLLSQQLQLESDGALEVHFAAALGSSERVGELVEVMEKLTLEPGDVLIKGGERANDIFFLAKGRVKVQVTLPNGHTLRLRTMIGGAIVGEMAFYLDQQRMADVIVELPSDVYRLTAAVIRHLEHEDPQLALMIHRLLAINISEKLNIANQFVQLAHR